jgi:hypothetical protein
MNTKAAIGIVAALIVIAGAFYYFSRTGGAPAPAPAEPVATTSEPITVNPGTAAPAAPAPAVTAAKPATSKQKGVGSFSTATFTASSAHPHITGSANVPEVQIVVVNAEGVGIVGGMHVPVVGGHFDFVPSVALKPGTYTLQLGGIDAIASATLVVAS